VGTTTVVLTSPRCIKEILDINGAVTGGRPQLILDSKVHRGAFMSHFGIGLFFGSSLLYQHVNFFQDSEVWKRGNKALHYFFLPESLANYLPTQHTECIQMCHDLLDTPEVRAHFDSCKR
jgi:hypothetical protein